MVRSVYRPGSTLFIQSSATFVPLTIWGNISSRPPPARMTVESIQLYNCSREPDEPASMTIPNRLEANHASPAVGGGMNGEFQLASNSSGLLSEITSVT